MSSPLSTSGGYKHKVVGSNVFYKAQQNRKKNYARAKSTDIKNRIKGIKTQAYDPEGHLTGYERNFMRHSANFSEYKSVLSNPTSTKRRKFDGTSEKELMKAMSTYLNQTGAGDYNLPNLIGDKIVMSNKKTNPNWSF